MTETAGQRIKRRRIALGFTKQGKFAEKVGMSQSTLSEIERGESKLPNAENLKKIAEELKTTPSWIMYGKDGELTYPTETESALLTKLRTLSAEQQLAIYAIIEGMVDRKPPSG